MADAALQSPAGASSPAPAQFDDLMLSMDVVDTLRHQEAFVARELNEDQREQELIERLRKIYRDQGIEVSDEIIAEGVKALKESRFVYTPPKPGFGVSLAKLWIARGRIGTGLAAVAGALGALWMGYFFFVERPARIEALRAQIEISQTLPKALDDAFSAVLAEAKTPDAKPKAEQFAADGRAALARQDASGARTALAGLDQLRADLRRSYQIMIVSRPSEPSGIYRNPPRNPGQQNYYLIVEAIGPDGRPISLPVTSEEDGTTKDVTKWAIRVNQQVFESVRRDKQDDGIVQNRLVGQKRRGYLDVNYSIPVSGGAIFKW
ncbi:DUF6384 family protein [Methylocapsa palsarum]|nr:DUF6384 family protein [Methylocapsa palsarum]